MRRILNAAGFTSIAIQPVELSFDLAVGKGLDGAVEAALSIGPVSRALEGQPPDLHEAVARSISKSTRIGPAGRQVELGGSGLDYHRRKQVMGASGSEGCL